MDLSRNKKNNVYPCKSQFYYIKVGFKGVNIIEECFRDACISSRDGSFKPSHQDLYCLQNPLFCSEELKESRGMYAQVQFPSLFTRRQFL